MPLNINTRRNAKPRKLKTLRLDSIEIKNEDDNLYYTLKCKTQNNVPVLYLSNTGRS